MNEDRLDELLLIWQEHQFEGRDISAAELCRTCPELAVALEARIDVVRHVNALMGGKTDAPSSAFEEDARTNGDLHTPPPLDQAHSSNGDTLRRSGPIPAPLPTAVAGYEIIGELGRGGMGVVYLARQIKLNRMVALKMILAGSHAGAEAGVRFLQEAETIASLKHPNVVQVFDFGSHENKPYFSLEFLEGGSLAARMKGEPQPPLQAARTVEILARAVQVAHEQGIVHRDLKPANVLLSADGVPKISDFGLAKQGDSMLTATGDVLGTPSYMSPEQAAGKVKEVGPPADVYALGAILYEMLTGRPPFKGASAFDTLQMVMHNEPVPPAQLQAKVPRDLDTICLRCLRKEASKRYDSAAALAEDLRRFQHGESILARPVGRAERLRRWCGRNPMVASLSAALLVALVAGLIGMTWLWQQADEQRGVAEEARDSANELAIKARQQQNIAHEQKRLADEQKGIAEKQALLAKAQAEVAKREAKKATRTAQLMIDMFEAADPLGLNGIPALKARSVETLSVREILDRGALQVARDLADEPDTQAKLLDSLGNVYCTLGLVKEGQPLLEKALTLRRRLLPANHPELAATIHNLAFAYHQTGDYPRANDLFREALGIRQHHGTAEPLPLSATCLNLGWLLADLEDFTGAEELFRKALDLRLGALGAHHRDVAIARVGLAASYIAQGKITHAVTPYLEAMTALRKIEGGKGLVESVDLFQKGVIGRQLPELLRDTLLGLKDKKAIEQCFQQSLELARKQLGGKHAYVALILHELACTYRNHGKLADAEQYFRDCLAVTREYGLDHPKSTIVLVSYSNMLQRRKKVGEAEKLLDEALSIRRQRFTGHHSSVADVLTLQARLLRDSGPSGRRRLLLREALEHYCGSPGTPPGLVVDCASLLVECLGAEEVYDVACQLAGGAAKRLLPRDRERYEDLAIRTLHQARSKGFLNRHRLLGDERLDVIGEHKDFTKLVARFGARDSDEPLHSVGSAGLVVQGTLTEDDPPELRGDRRHHKVYLVKLTQGKPYTISLAAKSFDTFLRVENALGQHLAEDDDGGDGTDSRLLFRPSADATYRLIVSTFDGRHGAFTLRVHEK